MQTLLHIFICITILASLPSIFAMAPQAQIDHFTQPERAVIKNTKQGNNCVKNPYRGVRVEGHRGVGWLAPQNSLEGFQMAADLGLDGFELDVHLTKDKVPVIAHGVTDGQNSIVEFENGVQKTLQDINSDELSQIKLPNGLTIPTLAEILAIAKGKLCVNIELKQNSDEVAEPTLKLIKDMEMLDWVYFTSFHWGIFDSVIEAHENLGIEVLVPMGYLVNVTSNNKWPDLNKFGMQLLSLDRRLLTENLEGLQELIAEANKHYYSIMFWSSWAADEDPEYYEQALSMGADTIITNQPVKCMKYIIDKYHFHIGEDL